MLTSVRQIDKYLKSVHPQYHYVGMSKRVEEVLEEELKKAGVQQFKLSARAKDKGSLKKKLMYRNETKKYKEYDDIKKDIADLAGVRVILYMPSDEEKVKEVVQKIWGKKVIPKKHPPPRDAQGT